MRKITLYRDDSTTQVVYENVKHIFWTANNSVLVIAQYVDTVTGEHKYIHWPRERFCWFKDEKQGSPKLDILQSELKQKQTEHRQV